MSILWEQMYEKQFKKSWKKALISKSFRTFIKSTPKSITKGFIGNNDVTYALQHCSEKNSIKVINFFENTSKQSTRSIMNSCKNQPSL